MSCGDGLQTQEKFCDGWKCDTNEASCNMKRCDGTWLVYVNVLLVVFLHVVVVVHVILLVALLFVVVLHFVILLVILPQ